MRKLILFLMFGSFGTILPQSLNLNNNYTNINNINKEVGESNSNLSDVLENPLLGNFISFLEYGFVQTNKSNKKPPEDLGSVISSIRIANQFQSNNIIFSYQNTYIKDQSPKRKISYTLKDRDSNAFFGIQYNFYDNRLEYRQYFDTNNYYTLDTYLNDYKENKIRFGVSPLDYFQDSSELSVYYFEIVSRGSYRIQSRQLQDKELWQLGIPPDLFLLYNSINYPNSTSFIDGTTDVKTQGIGYRIGFNGKFWYIFSIYNIIDFELFSLNGKLSTFSPAYQYYDSQSRQYLTATQILYVKKNLSFNMNMYYELGFSVTLSKVGFKWGFYWTLPLILDDEYLTPKGYIIYVTQNSIKVQELDQFVQLFYKGDAANQTSTFSLGLSGITFGIVSKF
jgi:hypothetical protein